MEILIAFLFCRGNIIYRAFNSSFEIVYEGLRNYLTRSAYRRVFNVFSEE